jgi:hypothetical protein
MREETDTAPVAEPATLRCCCCTSEEVNEEAEEERG